jgi:hypothetical protein
MRRLTRICVVLAAWAATACIGQENKPRVVSWKQEVPLADGRKLVIERTSEQTPFLVGTNSRMETAQELSFVHPDSGERVKWRIPKGLVPHMLEFDGPLAYSVLAAHSVRDYNDWECPNPPWIVYRYERGSWSRVPLDALPAKFVAPNVMTQASGYEQYTADGYVTLEEMGTYLRRIAPEYRAIGRQRINANAHGCFPSVLEKLGRSTEITDPNYKGERK